MKSRRRSMIQRWFIHGKFSVFNDITNVIIIVNNNINISSRSGGICGICGICGGGDRRGIECGDGIQSGVGGGGGSGIQSGGGGVQVSSCRIMVMRRRVNRIRVQLMMMMIRRRGNGWLWKSEWWVRGARWCSSSVRNYFFDPRKHFLWEGIVNNNMFWIQSSWARVRSFLFVCQINRISRFLFWCHHHLRRW